MQPASQTLHTTGCQHLRSTCSAQSLVQGFNKDLQFRGYLSLSLSIYIYIYFFFYGQEFSQLMDKSFQFLRLTVKSFSLSRKESPWLPLNADPFLALGPSAHLTVRLALLLSKGTELHIRIA